MDFVLFRLIEFVETKISPRSHPLSKLPHFDALIVKMGQFTEGVNLCSKSIYIKLKGISTVKKEDIKFIYIFIKSLHTLKIVILRQNSPILSKICQTSIYLTTLFAHPCSF
jgi:hypothetical protein